MTVGAGDLRLDRGALFTDHYQLVMAQLYHRAGLADRPAQFDYFYRTNPDYGTHQAGFCVTAGVAAIVDWVADTRFHEADVAALREIRTPGGHRTFSDDFLAWLIEACDFTRLEISGVREGRVVHPHVPLITVVGPLAIAQLLETALLNHLNYPTLIATKAARVAMSAGGAPVLEFGMRRGPGAGVAEAARAALIGGCAATSNVQASVDLGTSPRGTHGHSMVQAFMALGEGELAAFRAFAAEYPDDCVLLVDTIDTLGSGVPNAIVVFDELVAAGHRPAGIRLDSGDLAYLAVQSARMLDAAGFTEASIVLSSDLDELTIWQILTQIQLEADELGLDADRIRNRLVYGVGTRLITSAGDASLDGVYKLVGITDAEGTWVPAIKLSENPVKVPIPGPKEIWRLYDRRGRATVDVVTAVGEDPLAGADLILHHPHRAGVSRRLRRSSIERAERLHEPLFHDGRVVGDHEPVDELRARCRTEIGLLDAGVRRLVNPHEYHVSLSDRIKALQDETIRRARAGVADDDHDGIGPVATA